MISTKDLCFIIKHNPAKEDNMDHIWESLKLGTGLSDDELKAQVVALLDKDIETNPTNSQSNHQTSEEINPTVGNYIGNINSKKFHLPSCHTLPAEKNQIYFDTREAAIDNGYSPCGNCNP